MKTYITHLMVIFALTLGLSVIAVADGGNGAFKLEGAWVAKVVGLPGQWSYVISPDPSGKRASGIGSVDVGFRANAICTAPGEEPLFEVSDSQSPILVSMEMIGPQTVAYNSIWYGLKTLDPLSPIESEIVLIGTVTGTLDVVAPGKLYGTHTFALYLPDADTDEDGLPDDSAVPACVFQMNTFDTRLPMPE